MSFSFIPLAALTVLCVSSALACMFALLLEKLTGRTYGRFRLIFAALFLSSAIVCLALLLIFVPFPGEFSFTDGLYYGIIFLCGFIGIFFFRFVGLPLLILYGVFSGLLFFSVLLWAEPSSASFELEISPDKALLNGESFAVEPGCVFSDVGKKNVYMTFCSADLPEALLFPPVILRYKPLEIVSQPRSDLFTPEVSNVFLRFSFSIIETVNNFSLKLAGSTGKSAFRLFFAEIPLAGFYPVIYHITPRTESFMLSFDVLRLL